MKPRAPLRMTFAVMLLYAFLSALFLRSEPQDEPTPPPVAQKPAAAAGKNAPPPQVPVITPDVEDRTNGR